MELLSILEKAIHASIAGGQEILRIYETEFSVEYKNDRSPLTEADKASNNKIIEILSPLGIPFLSEEDEPIAYDERKKWERVWIIDPLDGTKEFVKRNGEFTVNIALVENGIPIMGVIFSPVFKDLYFASKGIGSFKLSRHDTIDLMNAGKLKMDSIIIRSVRLPDKKNKENYTIVASRSHLNKETFQHVEQVKKREKNVELINAGSSLKICLVAEGKADEYPRFGPTMEWDTAAGQAIVEMAGGRLLRQDNLSPLRYNREELTNPSFFVLAN